MCWNLFEIKNNLKIVKIILDIFTIMLYLGINKGTQTTNERGFAMNEITQEHKDFIGWLFDRAPFTATALESHWMRGERYYIDSRVDIRGKRRLFNRLNNLFEEK